MMPGWYRDHAGQMRWWDGAQWTAHVQPTVGAGYGAVPWGAYGTWPGSQFGRPATGPGSLASAGSRLGARLLDGLVLAVIGIPVTVLYLTYFSSHIGSMFPTVPANGSTATAPTPDFGGFFALEAIVFGFQFVVSVTYEALMTRYYGRTLGKKWLGIRPVRTNGSGLSAGRCWGRPAAMVGMSLISCVGLLNDLWLLWDPNRQCLHDKVADTIVVRD